MIHIVHEDSGLLVVDKPVGISAIPERDPQTPSLQKTLEEQRHERLWVVHRLDKEVSGLIAFARDEATHRRLSMAFERREIDKTYLALVHGVVASDGLVDAPIHEFGSGRMGVDPRGKASQTRYRVLARGPAHTLVSAHPKTGRRHQLRVHFYHLGHPIVGDPRYGDAALRKQAIARLMLHARNLVLPQPDGSALALEALPDEVFMGVVRGLGITLADRSSAADRRKD